MEKRKLTQEFVVANWRRPSRPIIKINFDGAFSNSMFRSTMGLVAWNMEGQVLFSCSMLHENTPSSFTIEAIVCLRAVQVGLERGWPKVTVEGDALVIIKKCQSSTLDKSQLSAYIHDIQSLRVRFQHIDFFHTPRSTNSQVNLLETESLKRNEEYYLEGGVPIFAERLMVAKRLREPN
ncbi:hypothetical protein Goari_014025 [Gossypium aridum]|uniref:RNase H type-1 domain-containing protein n=1 Tax=Gossypium aridum TaxID=34290 RepID=A0A7J8XH42_GOSAI|nr:hypothetical protein [Gossypium aridum]